ncbi:hypothetical protein B296_00034808 [Ensete ventricosum]|uniref:Uncharacterized protein n=1 Tax=Ensete ventricosum TaxID=4639 RepID=A0A426YMP1_ENSVE|nr:hypothetical protein B296_00034808 [Ensete ventricosum]
MDMAVLGEEDDGAMIRLGKPAAGSRGVHGFLLLTSSDVLRDWLVYAGVTETDDYMLHRRNQSERIIKSTLYPIWKRLCTAHRRKCRNSVY